MEAVPTRPAQPSAHANAACKLLKRQGTSQILTVFRQANHGKIDDHSPPKPPVRDQGTTDKYGQTGSNRQMLLIRQIDMLSASASGPVSTIAFSVAYSPSHSAGTAVHGRKRPPEQPRRHGCTGSTSPPVSGCPCRPPLPPALAACRERIGQCQQTPYHPRVILTTRQPPQFLRRDIRPDPQRRHARPPDDMPTYGSCRPASAQPQESNLPPVGITRG